MTSTVRLIESLSPNQALLQQIHERSLDVLETCGVRFYSERAREIWHGAGATINGDVVKIPASVVESALKKAPDSFTLYARDGEHDLQIGSGRTHYSQDGCAAHTLDFDTGVRRESRKADIEKMALISDYLDAIDIVSPTVSAQDTPSAGIALHELEACFVYSGKHVLTESVTSACDARGQIELAAVIAGGEEPLRERPIFSNFVCTVSPLTQDGGGIDAGLEFAAGGIPVGMYPMATTGVTSPVTLPGTLVVLNAEAISALALLQVATPGAKVFYSGGPATIDLRTGAYIAASPEAIWLRSMVAHMAGYYSIPCIVGAGATGAWKPEARSAWENTLSFLLPTLAGADVLFGMGLLDGSNLLTYEQIILDAEIGMLIRRLLAPVRVDDDTLALDLIKAVGPGGVFVNQAHTVGHMREALSLPLVSERDSYNEWQQKGQPGRVDVAREQVKDILAHHQPPALPEGVRETLSEIVAAYSAQEIEG
jgi:trimethylamine--corrinoid protein Co-methyltransferase